MNLPRFLLIETSLQPGFVALAEGITLLAVHGLDESRRHARDLAPAISGLLSGVAWQACDITTVVVSLGPGSYTGLRVGIMSAKTFAYATGCTLIGVETFAIIAAQAAQDAQRLVVIADAQQDRIYVQDFEKGVPLSPLQIQPFQDWLATVATPRHVTGPGLRKWAPHLPQHVTAVDSLHWNPRPEDLLQIAVTRHLQNQWTDIWKVEPIYLRPSAAEEQLARRAAALS